MATGTATNAKRERIFMRVLEKQGEDLSTLERAHAFEMAG
jgi:hypothetical protein